jgi:hypothetical protein
VFVLWARELFAVKRDSSNGSFRKPPGARELRHDPAESIRTCKIRFYDDLGHGIQASEFFHALLKLQQEVPLFI